MVDGGIRTVKVTFNTVKVEATILDFKANLTEDLRAPGYPETFDRTMVRIELPGEFKGKEMKIHHVNPVPDGGTWKQIGARIRFEIWDRYFQHDLVVYGAAAQNLSIIEK